MNKLLAFLLVVSTTSLAAQTPEQKVEYDTFGDKYINPHESHWLVTFGFEGLSYETPFAFNAVEKKNFPQEKDYYGGRLGFGREFYLGKGFMTSSKVEGYYVGTLFSQTLNAGPEEEDVEYASFKQTGNVWGVEAAQSLSYIFEMKTKNPIMGDWSYLTIEPFVEAGIGWGQAYARVDYHYDLVNEQGVNVDELYKSSFSDSLLNTRISVGVNLTSRQGYFLYMKVTQNRYDVTERKTNTTLMENGGTLQDIPTVTDKDVNIDPITSYAIGGGYKF